LYIGRFRLDADQADAGLDGARRRAHAGRQTAPAHRDHQHVEIGMILQHFERDRALPSGHQRVVEGMDKGQAQLLFHAAGISIGFVEGFAFQHHLAAHALGLHHLHGGRGLGHHDRHGHAKAAAVIGQALGMVAGAGRDDAAFALFLGQMQKGIERAAFLIGGGELQVFELQPDLQPQIFDRVREWSMSVRTTWPAIRPAAARISSMVSVGATAPICVMFASVIMLGP
jgi:hypothetical protein